MSATDTTANAVHDHLVAGLVRARHAADAANLDPDEVVTWMTRDMLRLVRGAELDFTVFDGFHGHGLRIIGGAGCVGFSAHPKLA